MELSYTLGLPILGPVVDRFGAYIVLGLGSVVWGVSTIALPVASAATSFFLLRMIFGLGHSMLISAGASAISRGFGVKERTRAVAIVFAGSQVGLASCATVAAFILAHLGWQAVFYCMGGASLLLTLVWFGFYPDKRIGSQAAHGTNPRRIPWLSWFRHRSTWGIAFGQMGYLYAYFFVGSWLPGDLVLERKMTLLRRNCFRSSLLGGTAGRWAAAGWGLPDSTWRDDTVSRKNIGVGLTASTVLVIC